MSDTTSLNRQTRRFAQRQGLLDDEGQPVRQQRDRRPSNEPRTPPKEFIQEVRRELKLVTWPSREEVMNYSLVVFTLLVVFTVLVGAFDYGLGEGITWLFKR